MLNLRTDMAYKLKVTPVDDAGVQRPIDGPIALATGDPAIVEVREHPTHGTILYTADDLGGELSLTTGLSADFDADLGEGVKPVHVEETLIVTGPGASNAIFEIEGIPKSEL